ncbi:Acg family FMN-binding oxidoreductase [Dactylosporangium matsuzakiense]|uniref:NAD(P)H nitroreductase n=1 Tax=Dactylosporangium matsuzakiense TaxID=53360 RepID=A0A9W6KTP1_9ACTN|nr:nitroreductase [Dactylosporangium matsuzakiense]UWZ42337.1 nitroreductase [Dactylosporangium matsuzakiense]GLL05289.1 NAD(P)H nitroreductase [Dactylosporangium matsuzakiense]
MSTVLHQAARDAGLAPSILNSQPWRWQVHDDVLDLYADLDRRLPDVDRHGRLMTISCGAALHHARVALAAAGYEPAVDRLPDRGRPALLARIHDCRARPATPESLATCRSMQLRHTDRRLFAAGMPVPGEVLSRLRAAAASEGARLHQLPHQDVVYLGYAARGAQTVGAHDARAAAELHRWTHRGADARDGIPPGTVAGPAARPVPVRDFGLGGEAALPPGDGDDAGAVYMVVATAGDEPVDWLVAGEAVSAVWLTATAQGLTGSPMSDVIEIPGARVLVRSLLPPPGQPQLVLRFGVAPPNEPPASPRRPAAEPVTEAPDAGEDVS